MIKIEEHYANIIWNTISISNYRVVLFRSVIVIRMVNIKANSSLACFKVLLSNMDFFIIILFFIKWNTRASGKAIRSNWREGAEPTKESLPPFDCNSTSGQDLMVCHVD